MTETLTRAASLAPRSFDPKARTAEAVISSGATVLRRGMHPDGRGFGPYFERLDLAGVDLSRMDGAPVLVDHRAPNSAARIGVVEAVRVERGALVAKLRFSERAEVAPS